MLTKEREIGQKIRNSTMRAVSVWESLNPIAISTDGKTFTEVSEGIFSVLERVDKKGRFFNELLDDIWNAYPPEKRRKTRGLPSIYVTACLMEEVLFALQKIHDAGYLFGDIQDRNVFFSECDIANNKVGTCYLIDFGSARKLESDNYTAPITNEPVFSTDGFCPFEIRDNDTTNGTLRLGKQADVYSAGCLMLRCVVSKAMVKTFGNSPSAGSYAVNEISGRAINCNGRALSLLNAILDKATRYDPEERYADAGEMLRAVSELKDAVKPPLYSLPVNLSAPDYFVPHSRDKELAALSKAVSEGKTVFIWGLGGIGKTETAIALAEALKPTKGAYLIHFKNSMRETIFSLSFSGYRFDEKNIDPKERNEAEYQERLNILRDYYRDTILIFDNFDCEGRTFDDLRQESEYQDIIGLMGNGIRLIFTTRYPVEQKEWEIRELSDESLLQLMRHHCRDNSIADEQYLKILREIHGHTLTAILIAKTLEESWGDISAEMILDALKSNRLSQKNYPEITSDQNRTYRQEQIYTHLKTLFDLTKMSREDSVVLCCATLLANDGMNAPVFRRCFQPKEKKALEKLIKCGWLDRTEDNRLTMHPVIREVCREELRPDFKRCAPFLDALWEQYDEKQYNHALYRQMADCFAAASDMLVDSDGDFAHRASILYLEVGNYKEALRYIQKALNIQEKSLPSDHPNLATLYGNLAIIYEKLDN